VYGVLLLIIPLMFGYIFLSIFNLSHFFQIILSTAIIGCIVGSSFFFFGGKVASHLISGVFLGFGIALQPLFKRLVDGMIFDATKIKKCDSVEIEGYKGRVVKVGLLHTWLRTNDGEKSLVMISNELLEKAPIKICESDATHRIINDSEELKFF